MFLSLPQRAALLLVGAATLAAPSASAQERDGGPPGETSSSAADGGATPTAPNDEPLPVLSGGVVGHVPDAPARPPDEREFSGQRRIGILLGGAHGYGTGLRLRASRLAIDLTGGFRPVFATYAVSNDDTPTIRLLGGFELAVAPAVIVYRAGSRTELGFAAAYAYNTLLGHGVTVAFHIDYDLGEHVAAHIFLGPTIFPKAESRIRAEADFPAGGSVSSGIAAFQGIAGVNLAFFP